MNALVSERLLDRLDRLERANRRIRRAVAALGIALAACAIGATRLGRPPARIEATAIVLTDSAGRERASLALQDGQPALTFRDEAGRPRVELAAHADQSTSLDFLGRDGLQMTLGGSTRGASLQLCETTRQLNVGLYAWKDGKAGLAVHHPERLGVQVAVEPAGQARLGIVDRRGTVQGGWMTNANGAVIAAGTGRDVRLADSRPVETLADPSPSTASVSEPRERPEDPVRATSSRATTSTHGFQPAAAGPAS